MGPRQKEMNQPANVKRSGRFILDIQPEFPKSSSLRGGDVGQDPVPNEARKPKACMRNAGKLGGTTLLQIELEPKKVEGHPLRVPC